MAECITWKNEWSSDNWHFVIVFHDWFVVFKELKFGYQNNWFGLGSIFVSHLKKYYIQISEFVLEFRYCFFAMEWIKFRFENWCGLVFLWIFLNCETIIFRFQRLYSSSVTVSWLGKNLRYSIQIWEFVLVFCYCFLVMEVY